jgi:hypothetical protein
MVAHNLVQPEDSTWYADSGTNHHLTLALENLHIHEPYTGSNTIAIGNGSSLQIHNTGSFTLTTPNAKLNMSRMFHCPQALANLLSINQFCKDNQCFLILIDSHYFIKDKLMGLTHLKARVKEASIPSTPQRLFSLKLGCSVPCLVSRPLFVCGILALITLPLL